MEFLNKSKTFGSEYDMHGVGSKKRYEEAKTTVTKLEEQLDTLKKGICIVLLQKFQRVKERKTK